MTDNNNTEYKNLLMTILYRIYQAQAKANELDWDEPTWHKELQGIKVPDDEKMKNKCRLAESTADEYLDCLYWIEGDIMDWVKTELKRWGKRDNAKCET